MSKYYLIKTDLPPMKLGKAKTGKDYAFNIDSVAELTKEELKAISTEERHWTCSNEFLTAQDKIGKVLGNER